MKKKTDIAKIFAAIAFVLVFSASCGTVPKNIVQTGTNTAAGTGEGGAGQGGTETSGVTGLTAKKLLECKDRTIVELCDAAFIYEDENEKKGICSYSGKDTGARYEYVNALDGLFEVSESYANFKTSNAVKDINVIGLADASGKTIIPCSCAYFKKLNDRYIEAYKVKAQAAAGASGDYIYKWNFGFATTKNDNYPAFSYEKSVYDVLAGKKVDESEMQYFSGSFGTQNSSFGDGSYVIRATETDTVYGPDDKVLFRYNPNEYQVNDMQSGYYIAEKVVNGEDRYLVLDRAGSVLSAEFDGSITVYGDLIAQRESSGYTLLMMDGKKVLEQPVEDVNYDALSKDLWVLEDGDTYIFVNGRGETLMDLNTKKNKIFDVNASRALVYETRDNSKAYYNFKEEEFSIYGYWTFPVGNLLVCVSDGDSRYDLIDVTNGSMLCEGYEDYTAGESKDGCCYIAAKRIEGGFDIYKVQNKIDATKNSMTDDAAISEEQLDRIYKTKEELFDELEKALSDAELRASVDRDSGEIAFDAAVVFAGDASEISAEGKKLLDAFMEAYGSVLHDEKYKGFISKTVVEGHTAPLASSTYESGLPLSQDRAENVKAYCQTIDADLAGSFEAVGYSNSMPIYKRDGSIDQDASRRVSFKCVINSAF